MTGVRHFKHADMTFTTTDVDGTSTSICRAIGSVVSATIGAGIEILKNTAIEWTVTYDEVLFINEGRITVQAEGKEYACEAGDIVRLPNGTTLKYDATDRCSYFYALYPADWAARQGTVEP